MLDHTVRSLPLRGKSSKSHSFLFYSKKMAKLVTEPTKTPLIRWFYLLANLPLWRSGLSRDTFWLMTGTIIAALGGFLYWKLVTFFYPSEMVGIAAAMLSSATFLAGLANLGLTTGIVRFLPRMIPQDKTTLIVFSYLVSAGMGLIASFIFLAGRDWWAPDFAPAGAGWLYFVAFMMLVLTLALMNVHISLFQAERQLKVPVWKNIGVVLGQILLILLLPLSLGAVGIVGAVLLSTLLFVLLLFWSIPSITGIPLRLTGLQTSQLKPMIVYSLGNQVFNLLWGLPNFFFPLLVLNRLGASANAHFAVPWLISNFVLIISKSVSVALLIDGSHDEGRLSHQVRLALLANCMLIIPLVLVLVALTPFILGIFGPEYASQSTDLLRLLVFTSLPESIISVYVTIKKVSKQIISMNLFMLIFNGLMMIISVIMVDSFGLIGVGWSFLLSHVLCAVMVIPRLWMTMTKK